MPYPLVYTVILASHRLNDILDCLESISKTNYENNRTILLESRLGVDFLETVKREYPEVQIISLTENHGYAGNNNIGIRAAMDQGADWVLLLNDDTVLDPFCISSMIEAADRDSRVGIAGPMVYHFDEPDVIQSAGGRLGRAWQSIHMGLNETDHGQYANVRQVEWISGCALLVRCALVKHIGPLDQDYFLYWEEIEWCIRAGRAGWKILHIPYAKLWHKGVRRDYEPSPYVTYYMTRNYLRTLTKHKAPILIRVIALAGVFRNLVSWSVKPRWRFKREHRNAMWKGLVDFLHHRLGSMPS